MSKEDIRSSGAPTHQNKAHLDPRTRRAINEQMDVLFVGIGRYVVHSESGNRYEVDIFERSCTCPDWQDESTPDRCKHVRRVDLEIAARTVPRPDGRIARDLTTTTRSSLTIHSDQEPTPETEDRIVGPIPEFDQYGRSTGATYWRCQTCGREALQRGILEEDGCDCRSEE